MRGKQFFGGGIVNDQQARTNKISQSSR
jgi:hypothetical protein